MNTLMLATEAAITYSGDDWATVSYILLGIVMWSQYPLAGAWAIGILLGIKLFSLGLIMVTTGSAVRSAAKA